MKPIILDLCGGTGSWSKYYTKHGYEVIVVTLPDHDVRTFELPDGWVYGIIAAPPCTMFSIARNDKTAREPRSFRKGMELVEACLRIIWEARYRTFRRNERGLKFWALENPNGYLRDFLGHPALEFHPYEYGDPYTKKTLIWGNFNIPKKKPVKPLNFEHPTTKGAKDFVSCVEHFADLKQIPEGYLEKTGLTRRAVLRSMTPDGFARAFFDANRLTDTSLHPNPKGSGIREEIL